LYEVKLAKTAKKYIYYCAFIGIVTKVELQLISGLGDNTMAAKEKDIFEPSLEVLGIHAYKPGKTEKYMGAKMHQHFVSILMALRQRLLEGGDKIVTHMKEEAINYPDPNDRASQEEDFRLELRTRDRERKLLKKIEESLELLREKDYGYCEVCGVEIGLRRLALY
jgi:DnaK suppressor protein